MKKKIEEIEDAISTINRTLAGLKRVYANPDLFPDRFTKMAHDNVRVSLEHLSDLYLLSETNEQIFAASPTFNPLVDRLLSDNKLRPILIGLGFLVSELLNTDVVDGAMEIELKDLLDFWGV